MRRRRFQALTSPSGGATTVDLAPLIDMVFLLLVFFVVTASFLREAAVGIQRPSHSAAQALDDQAVAVAITADSRIITAGRVFAGDDLSALAAALGGVERIVIQADRRVPTGLLLAVMDACQQAGAADVAVAAVQP